MNVYWILYSLGQYFRINSFILIFYIYDFDFYLYMEN